MNETSRLTNPVRAPGPGASARGAADPPSARDGELARLAKALGHPARVQILRLLAGRTTCIAGEISSRLPLAQSTVSEHLRVLVEAELVIAQPLGTRVCYCVAPAALLRFKELVLEM